MTHSEQINELAAALSAAQGEMAFAVKDTQGQVGQQKTRYADLASVWEAIRGPLAKNKLAVVQTPHADGNRVTVDTLLAHQSGQWVAGSLTLLAANATPQAVGSATTYARRYGLMAVVGVAPDDDDGTAAQGGVDPKKAQPVQQAQARTQAAVNGQAPRPAVPPPASRSAPPATAAEPQPGQAVQPAPNSARVKGWAGALEQRGLALAQDAVGWVKLKLNVAELAGIDRLREDEVERVCKEFAGMAKAGNVRPLPAELERARNLLAANDRDWESVFEVLGWPEDVDVESLTRQHLAQVVTYLQALEASNGGDGE